jgi:transposase InsO family protein
MEVSRSGFYSWLKKKVNVEELLLLWRMVRIFEKSRNTYGARRISMKLRSVGMNVGRKRAGSLMRKAEIEVRKEKKFRHTTDSKHTLRVSPNLLKRRFNVGETDRVWCADITFLWTGEGWLYLAVVIDLGSRKIVGWALSKRLKKQLVIDALKSAFITRRPQKGLIFHSDRGSQYASVEFRKLLKRYSMQQSMSRKGNCWDNAVVERFFRSLKYEQTNRRDYESRTELKRDIFDYIEMFYNRERLHSTLGYLSPAAFERRASCD